VFLKSSDAFLDLVNMDTKILKLLSKAGYKPSNVPQLIESLGLEPNQQQELQSVLATLETSGQIVRTKGNRYILSEPADLIPGIIQINRQGKGFLQPDEAGMKEIVIPESATSTAMNGDRVLIRLDVRPTSLHGGVKPADATGSVVRILERSRSQIVGTLQQSGQFLFVIPDDPRMPQHVLVPPPKDVGRKPNMGDKVVVELHRWESKKSSPEGEIIEVLGAPDEEGVDMLSVLRNYELPLSFPKKVLQEANTIAKSRPNNQPSDEEISGRLDCRKDLVITIDPDDAKDFDDAICLQRISQDKWKLWVHIADVSHYVKPGSILDLEARLRGNSTYLVDRVIPMLPEALSNELCSLKPNLDRLTKCVEFILSNDGAVLQTKFHAAVIRSQHRYTYKEVLALLDKPPTNDRERMVHHAHKMAQSIRKMRFKAGSLDLDFPESKIRLDEHGKILRIEKIDNDVSHQLIEEYMLLANEAVATRLMALRKPTLYRIHEPPKTARLDAYRDDVLGHKIPCGDLTRRGEVQKLFQRIKELSIGPALKIGFLKSLMRARYAMEPIGHYGLAKPKYTHFTSPIRRYADLVVHRSLFEKDSPIGGELKQIADHISTTERTSADAERDSKDVKLYAYLKGQLKTGELKSYSALVTDVRNFGFFVDVTDLGMSGLVHLSSIEDDFFVFDPTRNHVMGRRSRRIIKLGDRLMVQIYRVDQFKKQVDFQLEKSGGGKGQANAPRPKPHYQDRDRGREPQRQRGPVRDRGYGRDGAKAQEQDKGQGRKPTSPGQKREREKPQFFKKKKPSGKKAQRPSRDKS